MYLKYWYEDELTEFAKLDEKGSEWIYLTSREFERVFGFEEKMVFLTMEDKFKGDSATQRLREVATLNRLEEVWQNLKKFRDIRDIAIPYRIVCYKEKWFYNRKGNEKSWRFD